MVWVGQEMNMNALNLSGPEFLVWYLRAFALATLAFLVSRWVLRRATNHPRGTPLTDTYEIAWLSDGPRGVVRAALVNLHFRELINVSGDAVSIRETEAPRGLSTIERAVLRAIENRPKRPDEIEGRLERECAEIEARLAERGLALSPERRRMARWIPLLGMLGCFVIGVAKVGVGMSRGRPVGLLALLLIVSAGLIWLAARWRLRATTAGDRMLDALTYQHAALRTTIESSSGVGVASADMGLAVALFGAAAFGTMALSPLAEVFAPRKALASTLGGGGSGGDFGGGDGGGGGGGGCGGGGCGGCGGGS
jgi:uncharacterized protein (TIGR04222 family)